MKRQESMKILMINNSIYYLRQDLKLYEYLKYHSYWIEIITYDESRIKDMIKEMKIELKETIEDKIIDINKRIKLFNEILELMI